MKTKNLKSLLTVCSLTIQLFTFSSVVNAGLGGLDGGGGGVYKIEEGKYLTLPEFGVLIGDEANTTGKRYERYYVVTEETRKELKDIIQKIDLVLPGQKLSDTDVLGKKDTFVMKKDIDPNEYQKIKGEYKKVMNSYGYDFDDEKFILPAYSIKGTKGKTYILPDFLLLSPKQQAKILVHEFNMRKLNGTEISREENLRIALSVDVQINKIVNEKDLSNFVPFTAIKHFYAAELLNSGDIAPLIFFQMQNKLNAPILEEDLFLESIHHGLSRGDHTEINPSLVQEFQEKNHLSQNFAELLEGAEFYAFEYPKGISNELSKALDTQCSKNKIVYRNLFYAYKQDSWSRSRMSIFKFSCNITVKYENISYWADDVYIYNSTNTPLFFQKK